MYQMARQNWIWLGACFAACFAACLGACFAFWALAGKASYATHPATNKSLMSLTKPVAARVVSLDYCADQYVLHFMPRNRILALSPDATKPFSYHREKAKGLKKVAPLAETIIALQPDLIIRSYGGGVKALDYFERAGIQVVQLAYVNSLFEIPNVTRHVAGLLGNPEKGEIEAERAALVLAQSTIKNNQTLMYLTPGGLTAGGATLIGELIELSGFDNYETRLGWQEIPLERLVFDPPDQIAYAFFGKGYEDKDIWSPTRHPITQTLIQKLATKNRHLLSGAITSCAAWFTLKAIAQLKVPPAETEGK